MSDPEIAAVERVGDFTADTAVDQSGVRTALWRALHLEVDAPPPVFDDSIGLRLASPGDEWRQRIDMNPKFTDVFRASIVARARYIEDLVEQSVTSAAKDDSTSPVRQYVILGAGLDTFAQRRRDLVSRTGLRVYEIDRPGTVTWKKRRLQECDFDIPDWHVFVPNDFQTGVSWPEQLPEVGFDAQKPAIVSSVGVSMYLTKDAVATMLRQVAGLARGSVFTLTYLVPVELAPPEEARGREMAEKGAKAAGTPFISYFAPDEIAALAEEAGFTNVKTVSGAELDRLYFSDREDGLHPNRSEEILVAST